MKKVLFLMLFLVGLGAANLNSQVRIGGDGEPNAAAVLDLNADDSDTPIENKGALALPRVSLEALSGEDANLNGTAPIAGMLVYNTNTTLGEGVYFWDGSQWVAIGGDGIVGNGVMDVTATGGLERTGTGTTSDPYKVGIKTTAADAGLNFRSTGTGVEFNGLNKTTNIYGLSMSGGKASTVTYRGSFTYTGTLAAHTIHYFEGMGAIRADYCIVTAGGGTIAVRANNGSYVLSNGEPFPYTGSWTVACWRFS